MAHNLTDPLIEKLQRDLPDYLAGRRWYRAKAQTIKALTIHDIIHVGDFLVLLTKVEYSGGAADLYLLPVTSGSEESTDEPITTFEDPDGKRVAVYDAVHSPFFRTILFRALRRGAKFEGRLGHLHATGATQAEPVEGVVESTVSRAEQSNTSIIFGREYILKLFRKLEAGTNPDVEVAAFLTRQGFKNTPAVVGTLEYHALDGGVYSAGILQTFVPNQGDAWKYTLDSLSGYYQRALSASADDPELLADYADAAQLLGRRTAEMHIALASSAADPDFAPEPFTAADAEALAEEIAQQAERSLQLLHQKAESLPSAEAELAQKVLKYEPKIVQSFSLLKALATQAKRIRYHGDYHLGQVLATGSDFMIIDFEGEPARPLSERRSKTLALRDVAGMLRSFEYAAYAGLYGLVAGLPSHPEAAGKVASASAAWNRHVSQIYLDAYFETAAGHPFIPATPEQRRVFLDAFLLQKALYEVQYELNNRPAWVGIPLRGILRLMEN